MSSSRTRLAPNDEPKSLAWVQLHDQSPVSYGIFTESGYEELIAYGTPLPCTKSEKYQVTLGYIKGVTFEICYRRSIMDLPVEIETLDLHNVQFADIYVPRLRTTMMLEKDLTGRFTVEDLFTKSMASTTFDAGTAVRTDGNSKTMILKEPLNSV